MSESVEIPQVQQPAQDPKEGDDKVQAQQQNEQKVKQENKSTRFDVVGASAEFLTDVRDRLNSLPAEHREAVRRDLLRDLQVITKNVGANPLRRTPVIEVPHESGVGIRVIPQDEFIKGNVKTEEIPNTSPLARQQESEQQQQ